MCRIVGQVRDLRVEYSSGVTNTRSVFFMLGKCCEELETFLKQRIKFLFMQKKTRRTRNTVFISLFLSKGFVFSSGTTSGASHRRLHSCLSYHRMLHYKTTTTRATNVVLMYIKSYRTNALNIFSDGKSLYSHPSKMPGYYSSTFTTSLTPVAGAGIHS